MKLSNLGRLSKEDLLEALGLSSRPTSEDLVLPAAGLFAAGLIVGAGIGFLLAPRSGAELRAVLSERFAAATRKGAEAEAGTSTH